MEEQERMDDLVVVGDATALTRGDWMPGAMEGFVHPDFYDA
jgi:hypothetical protein